MAMRKTAPIKFAVLGIMAGLLLAGCGAKTGQATGEFMENRRFVPRIHVENDSFGVGTASGSKYWRCSYDMLYDGYWCPAAR